jgi:hypothetical protein
MPAVLTVEDDDIKAYLLILVDTYDAGIAAILAAWDTAIEVMIQAGYLNDAALTDILTLGKLLVICGQVKNCLPATATGSGAKTSIKMGSYAESTESATSTGGTTTGVSGDGLIEQGWGILRPYMTAEAIAQGFEQIISSTQTYAREFRLTHRDSEGGVTVQGTMEGW